MAMLVGSGGGGLGGGLCWYVVFVLRVVQLNLLSELGILFFESPRFIPWVRTVFALDGELSTGISFPLLVGGVLGESPSLRDE